MVGYAGAGAAGGVGPEPGRGPGAVVSLAGFGGPGTPERTRQ